MTDNNRLHNGQFAKGNPGKPKGATKNKLRDKIRTFLNDNFENLPAWFEELKPRDKMKVYIDLLPYCVSRLQSVSLTDVEGNELNQAVIDYAKLDEETLKKILTVTEINGNEEKMDN
jgi:hypothetical protein